MNTSEMQTINQLNEIQECSFNTSFQQSSSTLSETDNTTTIEKHKIIESESSPCENEVTKSKMELYMDALVHSTNCSQESCTFPKCLQLKRLIRHNKNCVSFINDRCEFCRQLIALSVYHAKNCTNHCGCLVPFCKTIKQKLEINKSIELITSYMHVVKYKAQKCQATQTSFDRIKKSTNKRKYSSLENLEETLVVTSASLENIFEDNSNPKNLEMEKKQKDFFEKLASIKENQKFNATKNDKTEINKQNREKIFATFFQQTLLKNPELRKSRTPKDQNYADLIVLLLRKEAEFHVTTDLEAYCCLVADMFYSLDKCLIKYKETSGVSCQTDTSFEEKLPSTSSDEGDETPNKRLKIN